MPIIRQIEVHPVRTRRGGLTYQFTPKHHGFGDPNESGQWRMELTEDEEFFVFDTADGHEIVDAGGNMYGLLRAAGEVRYLGTFDQQLAEFPAARVGEAWHGYPIYPVNELAPPRLAGQKCRPAKEIFARMEVATLISRVERKRLTGGRHV